MTYWFDLITVKPTGWMRWSQSYPHVECRWTTKVELSHEGYVVWYDNSVWKTWEQAVKHALYLCDYVITQPMYEKDNWQDAKARIEASTEAVLF